MADFHGKKGGKPFPSAVNGQINFKQEQEFGVLRFY
jgi:hypothetical protein